MMLTLRVQASDINGVSNEIEDIFPTISKLNFNYLPSYAFSGTNFI